MKPEYCIGSQIVRFGKLTSSDRLYFFLDYALIATIIYNSNSVYALQNDHFALSCFTLLAMSILYALISWITTCNQRRKQGIFVACAVAVPTLALQLLLNAVHRDGSLFSGTWVQYTLILPLLVGGLTARGFEYCRQYLFPRIFNSAFIIAIVSLFFWLFSDFGIIHPTSTSTSGMFGNSTVVRSYWGIYFNIQPMNIAGHTVWRNSAIFYEPIMLCVFIVIAISLHVLLNQSKAWVRSAIMVIVMLSSLATSGYVYIALLSIPLYFVLLMKIIRNQQANLWWLKILYPAAGILGIIVVCWIVFTKINTTSSGTDHFNDIIYGSQFRNGLGYTSGLIYLLIHGGIALAIVALMPILLLLIYARSWRQRYFAFLLLCILIFAIVQNSAIFIFGIAVCYMIAANQFMIQATGSSSMDSLDKSAVPENK